MDIICNNCSSKFRIPDEKIPVGRVTNLPCPKCKVRIAIDPAKKTARGILAVEESTAKQPKRSDPTGRSILLKKKA